MRKLRQNTQKIAIFLLYYGKIHSKLPTFCVKSVKNYTGQKKITRAPWRPWQIWGMLLFFCLQYNYYENTEGPGQGSGNSDCHCIVQVISWSPDRLHSIIHDNYAQKVLFLISAIKCYNTQKFTKIGSCLKSMKWCRRWKSIKRNHETCRTDQESKTARNKKRCFLF